MASIRTTSALAAAAGLGHYPVDLVKERELGERVDGPQQGGRVERSRRDDRMSRLLSRFGVYPRAILFTGTVLALITAAGTFWNIHERNAQLTEDLHKRIVEMAQRQAVSVSSALWDLNRESAAIILEGLAQDPDFVSARVLDEHGRTFVEVGTGDLSDEELITSQADIVVDTAGARRTICSSRGRRSIAR